MSLRGRLKRLFAKSPKQPVVAAPSATLDTPAHEKRGERTGRLVRGWFHPQLLSGSGMSGHVFTGSLPRKGRPATWSFALLVLVSP
jgi:hypothetical protein